MHAVKKEEPIMTNESVNQTVLEQWQRTCEMLKEAIQGFNDATWRQRAGIRPAAIALHSVETVEFYFSDKTPDEFPWQHRFGVDWEGAIDEDLPDQSGILAYLSDVGATLSEWFDTHELSAAEHLHPYTGGTVLARCLYVLRHTQHHIGQLNAALLATGQHTANWR